MGKEAVDLIDAAGQPLDPWQADVVVDNLATDSTGLWASFETCTIVQRQNGKGGIIEALELGGLFLFGERMILHSAHEYKTAQEAFLRIKALIDGCADLSRYVKAIREANGEQQIILMSGARLRFVARSKGSGRGFSGQRNILDEAYALTRTQLAALLPTMSAQPNPQMNLFSTAPDADTMPALDEAVLPDVRKRAMAAIETGRPGRLAYHEWSPPANFDPADMNVWYDTNPALGIRISVEYVSSELAALGPAKFATERCGAWPDAEALKWQIIAEADWNAALDGDSSPDDPVVFALWTSLDRASSAISVVGSRPDGHLHGEVVDHRPGTTWVIDRAVELVKKWRPARFCVDAGGAAGSMVATLITELVPEFIEEITLLTTRNVAQGYGAFHDAIKATRHEAIPVKRLRIRDKEPFALTAAAARASTRSVGDGTTWDSRHEGVDISPLRSLTDALQGYLTLPKPEPVYPAASAPAAQAPDPNFWRPTQRLNL